MKAFDTARNLIVVAAALCLAAPGTAEELAKSEFGLGLEQLEALEELAFTAGELDVVAAEPAEPIQVATLSLTELRSSWRQPQVLADSHTAEKESKTRRAGRWLKKRWWVPTLVGLAVAVAVLEPFDDDDAERRAAQMQ